MKRKKKNEAAAALVRRRWNKTTAEERSEHGKKMADARWKKKTPKRSGRLADRETCAASLS